MSRPSVPKLNRVDPCERIVPDVTTGDEKNTSYTGQNASGTVNSPIIDVSLVTDPDHDT